MSTTCTPLPRSRARNAYALMRDINKAILTEPRRLNMSGWLVAFQNKATARIYQGGRSPSCGTVGCYAGWCTLLKAVTLLKTGHDAYHVQDGTETFALNTLSGPYEYGPTDRGKLRNALLTEFLNTEATVTRPNGQLVTIRPGTTQYAKIVVKRFENIMRLFKSTLKDIEVQP